MGENRNAYIDFVGNPERKAPTGRHGHRWQNIIQRVKVSL
jgi:hypothetical protein